jgi:hypothetical protein
MAPIAPGSGRLLTVDAYNVMAIFVKLGLSFDEIAALGFYMQDEPDRKLTAAQLQVWFEEETRLRAPTADIVGKKGPKGEA